MKTKLCKVLLIFVIAAMVCCVSACGNGKSAGQSTSAPTQTAEAENSAEKEPGSDGADVRTEGAGAEKPAGEPEESEPEQQVMGIEQYEEMAGKFAFYCDSVYFDYQGDRGTVTILDIRVDEDTESQCRITVYYQEPELTSDNSYVAPTDGYMTFIINKATMQGQMECWNFLGVPGEYLEEPVDQMDEAIYYSGFVYSIDDVYDFATGTILTSSGSVLADVNAYISP